MAQKTFFAVKDLDGDGKHYCAVSFESKLAREAFCELNGYEPVLVKWAIDNLAGSCLQRYPTLPEYHRRQLLAQTDRICS